MATAKAIDFTNVKEGGNFNKRRMPAGDYPARITKVEDTQSKEDGDFMWLFTIAVDKGGTYPYYCKLVESQLWKVRNICLAAGMNVPKKRLKLDPEKLVGKRIAVTLEDDEYDGKPQSVVNATFPLSELDDYAGSDDEDAIGDDGDDEDDDEEEPTPPPARKAKKKPEPEPEPEEEDDEDEDDEEDELAGLDRTQLKRRLRKASPGVSISRKQTDDDLRAAIRAAEGDEDDDEEDEDTEDEAPPPKAKKKTRSTRVEDVTDDELDELDIDEI